MSLKIQALSIFPLCSGQCFDVPYLSPQVYKMAAADPDIAFSHYTGSVRKNFFLSRVLLEKTTIHKHPQQIFYHSLLAKVELHCHALAARKD